MPAGGLTVIAIAALCAGLYYVGDYTVKGVKKIDRGVCHVVTLGHKCKPKPKSAPQNSEVKK